MAESIQLEVFGGDVPSVEISGLTGHGLPQLVETLSAMAELQDLRAERDGPVHGYVLESKVHKGLGSVFPPIKIRCFISNIYSSML
jgi:translation initiation factor IF-2